MDKFPGIDLRELSTKADQGVSLLIKKRITTYISRLRTDQINMSLKLDRLRLEMDRLESILLTTDQQLKSISEGAWGSIDIGEIELPNKDAKNN